MSRLMKGLLLVFGVVAVALIWFALSRSPAVSVRGKTTLRFQLQWFHQAQFVGYYVAQERGFYDRENLDVRILEGGFNSNPITRVRTGGADVALATGDQVMIQGALEPGSLKVIGTVFDGSVAVFMSRSTSPARTPSEMQGKTVGYYGGFDTENILLSLLTRSRIPLNTVNMVQASTLQAFRSGDMDVFPAYAINEPVQMRREGTDITLLYPDSFGVHYYSDSFFTTGRYWNDNRDVLRRFLRASAEGWRYARENPDAAVSIMLRFVRTMSRRDSSLQRDMLEEVLAHMRRVGPQHLFEMDSLRWVQMEGALRDIGRLNQRLAVTPILCDFDIARGLREQRN